MGVHGRATARWRAGGLLAATAIAGGCRPPPPPPEPIVSSLAVPVLTATSRPTRATAGPCAGPVVLTVEPVAYAVVPEVQQWPDDVGVGLRESTRTWQDGGVWEATDATPVQTTRFWAVAVRVVVPDRVGFVLSVANRSRRPFVGRGTGLRFVSVVDGRPRPESTVEGLGLAAVRVPPGGCDRVTVYGPPLAEVPARSVVGLRVTDLPAGVDVTAAGRHDDREATWWYAVDADEQVQANRPWVSRVNDVAVGPTAVGPASLLAGNGGSRHR